MKNIQFFRRQNLYIGIILVILLLVLPMNDIFAQYWMADISGHVRTSSGDPIEGVQVSNATTDANGYYQVTLNAMFGVFVTPQKEDWTFTPETLGYPNGGTYTDQDYVGTYKGGTVTSNIITFSEDRYRAIAWKRFYRGGSNTIIDTEFGVEFYVAYGDMTIMHSTGTNYTLAFSPYTPSNDDPRGRVVIIFNNLQEYVRIDVSTDGTPIHQPAYLRVSYYSSTQPENPLYSEDGGGNIEYTNTNVGIKMLIVDTHFAENNIDELEFRILEGSSESKPAPTSLITLSGYNLAVPIAWKAPATRTPDGYNVYRSTVSGSPNTKIASNIQETYYRDAVYTNSTLYYVVTAIYSDGESDYSLEKSAEILGYGNTGESNWTTSTPTLDGIINTSEWQDAAQTTVSYPGGNEDVTMYAMNTGSELYLALDNPRDASLDNGDNFSLFIDSNYDYEWPGLNNGHDGMLRFTWNDGPTVFYRSMYGTWPNELATSEWSNPVETTQAFSNSSGHVQYEAKIDLNSYIIDASPGEKIGLCCFVWDNGKSDFDGLKPYETENLSALTESYFWCYGPFAYMDFTIADQVGPTSVDVTFTVMVPNVTPDNDQIYLAGTFNFWDPGPGGLGTDGQDHDLPLTKVEANRLQITLPFSSGENIEYKYTRGSWEAVEVDLQGEHISNRLLTVPGNNHTQNDHVERWVDDPSVNVTFTVDVPNTTPGDAQIYIAGNFNSWDPGPGYTNIDDDRPLTKIGNNQWQITIPFLPSESIEYKYTRGSWGTVEKGPSGEEINDRVLIVQGNDHTQNDNVESWADIVVSVDQQVDNNHPGDYSISQNYPNPFNPETTISYQLPRSAKVNLTIYDLQGHEIQRLVNNVQSAGHHSIQWDGRNYHRRLVTSGMYFYRIEIKQEGIVNRSFVDVKKMILLK